MSAVRGPLGFQPDDRYRHLAENQIIGMLVLMGWPYETTSVHARDSCREALRSWMIRGLGSRLDAEGQLFFDPVEVSNFMRYEGHAGRDDFWQERYVYNLRRLVRGQAVFQTRVQERTYRVEFRRQFHLQSSTPGTKMRLRAPLPLESETCTDLRVRPWSSPNANVELAVRSSRLEARTVLAGQSDITFGADLEFVVRRGKPPSDQGLTEAERTLYLQPREGLIVITERINALAASIPTSGPAPLDVVRSMRHYLHTNLSSGMIHYDQIDPAAPLDSLLDTGWFDCQMASSLLVALCRARGIPSRVCGGYFLYPEMMSNHYWSEIWLDDQGWFPIDSMAWDLSLGDADVEWRDHFFGRLDDRLICERLPRDFTGALGLTLPPAWFMLQLPVAGGISVGLHDVTGPAIYTDTLRLHPVADVIAEPIQNL